MVEVQDEPGVPGKARQVVGGDPGDAALLYSSEDLEPSEALLGST
jgi:hypothetical protein